MSTNQVQEFPATQESFAIKKYTIPSYSTIEISISIDGSWVADVVMTNGREHFQFDIELLDQFIDVFTRIKNSGFQELMKVAKAES